MIDTLNYGIDNYNLYLTYKNRQFRSPKLEDSQIKALIDNANNGVNAADKIFCELFSANAALNDLIMVAKSKIPVLLTDVQRENDFLDRYLQKWKPLRGFMFYSYGYKQ